MHECTALFMALHLELVFYPLCMCSIAVPKIDMVTNTKLVELGILKPGNAAFLNLQSLQRKCEVLSILCSIFILQDCLLVCICRIHNLHEFHKDKNVLVAFSFIWNFTSLFDMEEE